MTRATITAKPASPMAKDPEYCEREVVLELGDRLYVYTDGLIEAEDADEREFGAERLERQRVAGKLDARSRLDRLFDPDSFVELGPLAGTAETPADQARSLASAASPAIESRRGRPLAALGPRRKEEP